MYEQQREKINTHVYQNMNKRVMKRTCDSVLCFSTIGVRYQNMTGFEKQTLFGSPDTD